MLIIFEDQWFGCAVIYQGILRLPGDSSLSVGIFAAMVFNTISSWSQFIVPYILLADSSLFPVSVGVLHFQTAQTEGEITAHLLAAAAVIAMMPAILLFVFLQRFVVSLMVAGAVKG